MEKGAYKMRPPRRRSSTTKPPSPYYTNTGLTPWMALVVALLAMASITSFGAAYYLFTTRWETRVLTAHEADQEIQVVPFEPDSNSTQDSLVHHDPHEKYLAYLPHSGFHNQRIAFENALVLSGLLNRTLLVPPIRLGSKPLHYSRLEELRQSLADDLEHCFMPECDRINMLWESLVDLSYIKSQQPLQQRSNMTDTWIRDHLQISEEEVLTLDDSHLYQYRFFDSIMDTSPANPKYLQSIHIPTLALTSERLLQIGTLFGSSRLRLLVPQNIRVRSEIRRSMAFANPDLVRAADSIAKELGGTYLGVHIRVGDGHFHSNRFTNARRVWWKLVHQVLGFSIEDALALEVRLRKSKSSSPSLLRPPQLTVDHPAERVPHPPLLPLPEDVSNNLSCRGPKHTLAQLRPLNVPLFISTDSKKPLMDSTMAIFLRTFPCTFFLSDFPNTRMVKDILSQFLEAMVVGKAWAVVGTEGSTFSQFVEDVLWRRYHGLAIVERG